MGTLWVLVFITVTTIVYGDGKETTQYAPQQMIFGLSEMECRALAERARPWHHEMEIGDGHGLWSTTSTVECWREE